MSFLFVKLRLMKLLAVRFRRTTIILWFCIAFLSGIGLARTGIFLATGWLVSLLAFAIISYRKKNIVTLGLFIALGIVGGVVRGSYFLLDANLYSDLYEQKVTIIGTVKNDAIYGKNGQLSFDLTDLELTKPTEEFLVGTISISGYGENAIYSGDTVLVSGKLYSTLGSKQGRMSFAEINTLQHGNSAVQKIKREFVAGMYSAVPEPEASFGLGLLVGQRNTLPENVSDTLKIVGLTHIVAVSGYNLTILVRAAQRMFGKRSKYQATLAAAALIVLFLAVTGLSASIVRAAIVSGLGLTAWYFGRSMRPTVLIAFTAALTAGYYPIYLWSDIGWYLSFLAFFGVLVIAPLLTQRIWGKEKRPSNITQIIIESICAQIMTIPLILYIFHQTSLIGLLANVLVVPLIPFAMLFGLIAGLAGMLIPAVAGWFAWPATILLTYMLDIASLLAKVPHAQLSVNLGLFGMIFLYGVLLFFTYVLYRKVKSLHGIIVRSYLE